MSTADKSEITLPKHVPETLFWNHSYDAYAAEGDDPYLAVGRLHDGPGIIWARDALYGEPGWVVSRHDYIRQAFLDPEHFSSDRQNLKILGVEWKLIPLELDPPEHHHYRMLLNPYFTPAKMSELDGSVRQTCDDLITEFENAGGCDFAGDFAEKFPSYVFLDLMGLPKDRLSDFLAWERGMMQADDPGKRLASMQAILQYLEQFVQEQMQHPDSELLEGLVSAHYKNERKLSKDEILSMCYLLYIGGLDTVFSTLGWIFRHLAGDQSLQVHLRNNLQDIPYAVEEFARAFSVSNTHRHIKKDLVFQGVEMKAGDIVRLSTPAAGRDPHAFPNPDKIDIERQPRHLAFATGPHTCLGMHLAKRELRTVIEAFLTKFENIHIPEGETYEYHTHGDFGVDRLPLTWS